MRLFVMSLCALTALTASAAPTIKGQYLEVRSCDVYTGPCFANGEMGQTGKEAIMVWKVSEGEYQGAELDGLSVMAVVRVADTLGDISLDPQHGRAVLIVDEAATPQQRDALTALAHEMAGDLVKQVEAVKSAPMQVKIGACEKSGCASAKAGDLVDINTRCLGSDDHVCGNESTFYPPLTEASDAFAAYTEVMAYHGTDLGATWSNAGSRGAFIGSFVR